MEPIEKTGCDIQAIAEQKLQTIISSGVIDKIIEDKLTETCKSIIGDSLKSYSEFGEQLKKVINEKLKVNLDTINLGSYSGMIVNVIEESMVGILDQHKATIKKTVENLLEVPEKKEWKLSEIVAKYRSELFDNKEVALDVESEAKYSSRWIRLGEKKEKSYSHSSDQSYVVRMLLDEKTKMLSNVWYENKPVDPRNGKVYGHRIEGFLMNLWAHNCTIELDTDEAEYEATKDEYED